MSERCGKCNRQLRDPLSKGRGFGPVCWDMHVYALEVKKNQGKLFNDPELSFTGDIIVQRNSAGGVMTNVPHQIISHSPDGFEWGYAGSGPSELALNILTMFTDRQTAEELHQVFKWDYITRLPYDGGTIKGRDIKKWIKQHKRVAS
jgi:hypothetical protein